MEYFHGDKIEYTGKSEFLHGKMAFEYRFIEGHRIGETGWTYTPEACE